jgi:REP element-mobilizing transposase RayT
MPRKRRLTIPGEIHHVMSRGIDGMDLFRDDADRGRFVSLLARNLPHAGCRCYAWVLMNNHYHLLLRPLDSGLIVLMRRINTAYARYYNNRHSRKGYLFQDRYKSLATQEFSYVRELIRYIHLNPVRAGLIGTLEELARYPWSGHPAMLGKARTPWQSVDEALSRFGRTRAAARTGYMGFLADGIGCELEGWRFSSSEGGVEAEEDRDDRVAGEAEFVRKAVARVEKERRARLLHITNRPSLDEVYERSCLAHGITRVRGFARGRLDARSKARCAFVQIAVREHAYTVREVAAFIGVNPGSASRMVKLSAAD